MGPLVPGVRSTLDDTSTVILDLADGLKYLNQEKDGVKFLMKLGTNGFTYHNQKHEWTETALATREEVITIGGLVGDTTLTVANAYQYQVNCLLRVDDEILRVTAIASATTLTVTRGYAGTTRAAHTAKLLYSVGPADPEGADAPAAINNKGARLYNYSQTFTRAVGLTTDELTKLQTEAGRGGNPMNQEIEMRMIELHRELARACIYGIRYEDTSLEIYAMGGFKSFITTNVYNVGGAITIAVIDQMVFDILKAGGDPKLIAVHPTQKRKIDALDANLVRLGLKKPTDNTGGNPITNTWQSGLLDHPIEIITDWTFLDTECHMYDLDYLHVGHKVGWAVNKDGEMASGNFAVMDSTKPGADRSEKVIRGKFSTKVEQEKAHAIAYALTT